MTLGIPTVGLIVAACAGWWWVALRSHGPATSPLAVVSRAVLIGIALIAHVGEVQWLPGGVLHVSHPRIHAHELVHYLVGTRYFAELGYSGIYDAVLVADWEDARGSFDPEALVRDQVTHVAVERGEHLDTAQQRVRASFRPERWAAFKGDLSLLRRASDPRTWETMIQDHGYNGTPLVTLWLLGLGSQSWVSTEALLAIFPYLDLAAIALFGALVWAIAGWLPASTFLFVLLANPFHDHSYIGGSFLRSSHLLLLAGAALALRRNAMGACGVLMALAGGLRIFPLLLYGCILLRDVLSRDWSRRLRESRRMHAAFAASICAIFAATFWLPTPDERSPWISFAEKIGEHAGGPQGNLIQLTVPLLYSPDTERFRAKEQGLFWELERERVRRDRAWLSSLVAGVALAMALAVLSRASRQEALVPGMLVVFTLLPLSHYYYASLAVLPLALSEDVRIQRGLMALFVAVALTFAPGVLEEHLDLRFAAANLELLAFLSYASLVVWRGSDGSAASSARLAGSKENPA